MLDEVAPQIILKICLSGIPSVPFTISSNGSCLLSVGSVVLVVLVELQIQINILLIMGSQVAHDSAEHHDISLGFNLLENS